jgi:hypothetical protein
MLFECRMFECVIQVNLKVKLQGSFQSAFLVLKSEALLRSSLLLSRRAMENKKLGSSSLKTEGGTMFGEENSSK